jgi:hypothetical protein
MFINIVGAIIYFLGVLFAFTWGVNLRYRAKTGQRERIFEVFGLLMAISLILIPTLSLSPFHILWMFPMSFLLAPLSILFPLNLLLWPLASLYASFWYIGLGEEGYKGGLVSRVKNKHSGKRYIISTAQEIGKDYWTTVVLPARFFRFLPDGFRPIFTWVRNTKEKAHDVHWMIKKIVIEEPEDKWIEVAPSPIPPDGFSEDAKKTFKEKLGFIPREVQLLEKKMNQNNFIDLIDYFRLKNWIEEKTKLKVTERGQEEMTANLIRREYNKLLRNLFIFGIILLAAWIILNSVLPNGLAMGIINTIFLLASLIWGGFLATTFKLVLPEWLSFILALIVWILLFIGIRSLF